MVAVPDEAAQLVAAQIIPDIFHRIEFGGVGRQWHQRDVVGYDQAFAWLVPAGTVADQYRVGGRRDLRADFLEVFVHRFGVHARHDDACTHATRWTDCPKDIQAIVAGVAHHRRPQAVNRRAIGTPAGG